MGHLKNIEGIEITFNERILIPLWFIYEVEICNTGDKQAKYDLRYLTCNAGINAIQCGKTNVLGYELLTDGHLKKGESVMGYIAFERLSIILTNQPHFQWHGIRKQIRPKDLKRGENKHGRN